MSALCPSVIRFHQSGPASTNALCTDCNVLAFMCMQYRASTIAANDNALRNHPDSVAAKKVRNATFEMCAIVSTIARQTLAFCFLSA